MKAWQVSVGDGPTKVTAIELPYRGSVAYLRWREAGNWKWQSLGKCVRTQGGRLNVAACDRAVTAARAKVLARAAGVSAGPGWRTCRVAGPKGSGARPWTGPRRWASRARA